MKTAKSFVEKLNSEKPQLSLRCCHDGDGRDILECVTAMWWTENFEISSCSKNSETENIRPVEPVQLERFVVFYNEDLIFQSSSSSLLASTRYFTVNQPIN